MIIQKLRGSSVFLLASFLFLALVTYYPLLVNPFMEGREYKLFLGNLLSLYCLASVIFIFAFQSHQKALGPAALFGALVLVNPLSLPIILSPLGGLILSPIIVIAIILFLLERVSLKLLGLVVVLLSPILILGSGSYRWGVDMGIALFGLWALYYLAFKVFSLKKNLALALSFLLIISSMGLTQYRAMSLNRIDQWISFKVHSLGERDIGELWRYVTLIVQLDEIPRETLVDVTDQIVTRNDQEEKLIFLVLNTINIEDQSLDEFERRDLLGKNLMIIEQMFPFDKLGEVQLRALAKTLNRVLSSSVVLPYAEYLEYFYDLYQIIDPLLELEGFESLESHRRSLLKVRNTF